MSAKVLVLFAMVRARLLRDERGFTMIEALAAGMILAVGSFAVAQSLNFGLRSSGLARNKLAAQAAAEQQMELARLLNYDSQVLSDTSPIPHSTDPTNPDYWVDAGAQTYDATGTGCATCYESIVRSPGASPSLNHLQTPVVTGNTTMDVYMYVTWVDSPLDGSGASDKSDGNQDGTNDANGHDQKRVTVVIRWTDRGQVKTLKNSSLFSDGKVTYHPSSSGGLNQSPSVSCPTTSSNGRNASFTADATDSDGFIAQVDWSFGDGTTLTNGGANQTHQYSADGTYTVRNTVWDNGGASASNTALNCAITVTGNGGSGSLGSGSVVLASGAAYTTTTQITLTLSGPNGSTKMQFSDDGAEWGSLKDYATSAIYTLPTGDGSKTVYVRFLDASGNTSPTASDTVILDTGRPGAPRTVTASRASNKKSATLSWLAPSPSPSDLAGYQIWRRPTTQTSYTQITNCAFSSATSCVDPGLTNGTSYEYYILAVDNAGNQSVQSNHVTV